MFDVAPGTREVAEPLLRQVLETGEPISDVQVIGDAAATPGRAFHLLAHFLPVCSDTGALTGVAAVMSDVTDRSTSLPDTSLMEAPIGLALVDTSGDIVQSNVEFRAILDRQSDEAGSPLQIVRHAFPVVVSGEEVGSGVVLVDMTEYAEHEREQTSALRDRVAAQKSALDQLQLMLLPDLPRIEGWFVEASYWPAEAIVQVGGDWYDCFTLADGRIVVAVGDALGHGLKAIRIMDTARHAIRTLMLAGHSLDDTIRHTNVVLCEIDHATATVAVIDPTTGAMDYVIAGHPPPLIRRGNGSIEIVDQPRTMLLGAFPDIAVTVGNAVLAPSESLVMYTDGLIERRGESLDVGVGRLTEALERAERNQPPPADQLIADASVGHSHDDDVCTLIATRSAHA